MASKTHRATEDDVEVTVHRGRTASVSMFSFRLKPGELAAMKEAAERLGLSTGEFVRQAAMAAATAAAGGAPAGSGGAFLVVPLHGATLPNEPVVLEHGELVSVAEFKRRAEIQPRP